MTGHRARAQTTAAAVRLNCQFAWLQARRQAWTSLAELRHHTCPAISLAHLPGDATGLHAGHPAAESASGRQLLFSGGTDGGIAIWDVSTAVAAAADRSSDAAACAGGALAVAQLAPVTVLQGVHQSGVNSLAAAWLPSHSRCSAQHAVSDAATAAAAPAAPSAAREPRTAVLVSGGDDQAIVLTTVAVCPSHAVPQLSGQQGKFVRSRRPELGRQYSAGCHRCSIC